MQAAIDRAHSADLSRHLSATERAEAEAPAALEDAYEQWLRKATAADVLDNLCDVTDELQTALLAGDEAMVGRIVLAVRRAYAQRLAMRDVYGEDSGPTNEEAVADVLAARLREQANQLIRQHAKARVRRFSGEAITNLGGL